jgi:hypothetical protein
MTGKQAVHIVRQFESGICGPLKWLKMARGKMECSRMRPLGRWRDLTSKKNEKHGIFRSFRVEGKPWLKDIMQDELAMNPSACSSRVACIDQHIRYLTRDQAIH